MLGKRLVRKYRGLLSTRLVGDDVSLVVSGRLNSLKVIELVAGWRSGLEWNLWRIGLMLMILIL
jgi:hypothetical protein